MIPRFDDAQLRRLLFPPIKFHLTDAEVVDCIRRQLEQGTPAARLLVPIGCSAFRFERLQRQNQHLALRRSA